MDIDIENLIMEVEKRPTLYNTASPEYYDRIKKKELWEEIYVELNDRWTTFNQTDKTTYGREVQKKWCSLRDCFRRELIHQVHGPAVTGGKKKAKYKYFDALLFLLPHTQIRKEPTTQETQENSSQQQDNRNDDDDDDDDTNSGTETAPSPSKKRRTEFNKEVLTMLKKDYNTVRNNYVKAVHGNNVTITLDDDDKFFLLSLLPCFKNSTMEEKYLLRIELMQTIMNFKQSRNKDIEEELVETEHVDCVAQLSPKSPSDPFSDS